MAFVFEGRTQSCGAQRIPQNCTEAIEWGAPVRPNLSEPSPPHCDKVFTSVAIRDHLIQIFRGRFDLRSCRGFCPNRDDFVDRSHDPECQTAPDRRGTRRCP
jgi:hypothetical protein